MNIKPIIKPQVPETLFYGEIVSWNISTSIIKDRERYCYKVTLNFSSGYSKTISKGGFKLKKSAARAREYTITQLNNHDFVAFDYTGKEFFDFWLYYYMLDEKKISYATFMSYRNIIYNYFLPVFGDMKIKDLEKKYLIQALNSIPYKTVKRLAFGVMGGAFSYAKQHNIISINSAQSAVRHVKKADKKELQNLIKAGIMPEIKTSSFVMPDLRQISKLIYCCREKEPDIFLPLLLAFTTGLRISEIIGIKYEDIDYSSKILYVSRQLGRTTSNIGVENGTACIQELNTKTVSGVREVPITDFVIEEIFLARARYENRKRTNPQFSDSGFLFCDDHGRPHHRNYVQKPFKRLLAECEVAPFRWHDIRHIYATVLKNDNISLKAISAALGHASTRITEEVYIEKSMESRIADCSSYMNSAMEELLPEEHPCFLADYAVLESFMEEILPKNPAE